MSIKKEELLKDVPESELTEEQKENLEELLPKLNKLRAAYGKPLRVTSGVRSMKKHLQIYKQKGITDKKKIPMKSKHLLAQAADIVPVDGNVKDFQKFILDNIELMEDIGIYFEDFKYSPTWVHVQSVPFGSYKKGGTIFFIP